MAWIKSAEGGRYDAPPPTAEEVAKKKIKEKRIGDRRASKLSADQRREMIINEERDVYDADKAAEKAGLPPGQWPSALGSTAAAHVPDYIVNGWDEIRQLYTFAARLQYVYQTEFEPQDKYDLYLDQIHSGTLAWNMEQGEDASAGAAGGVKTRDQALAALGPVELDDEGNHAQGTNWLDQKTWWRMFGLLTGYNMHVQRPYALELKPEPVGWAKGEKVGDKVYIDKVASARIQYLRTAEVKDPRYVTNAIGASEPHMPKQPLGLINHNHVPSFLRNIDAELKPNGDPLPPKRRRPEYPFIARYRPNTPLPHVQWASIGINNFFGFRPPTRWDQRNRGGGGDITRAGDVQEQSTGGGKHGHVLGPEYAYWIFARNFGPDQAFGAVKYETIAAARQQLCALGQEVVAPFADLGPATKGVGRRSSAPLYPYSPGSGPDQNNLRFNDQAWAAATDLQLGNYAYEQFMFEPSGHFDPEGAERPGWRTQTRAEYRARQESNEARRDRNTEKELRNKATPQDGISRYIRNESGRIAIPDSLLIFPTLPLDGFPLTAELANAPGQSDTWTPLASEAGLNKEASTVQIQATWNVLFEEFKEDVQTESYATPLGMLHKEIMDLCSARDPLLAGSPDVATDEYKNQLKTTIEQILDFFNAGEIDEQVLAQVYGERPSISGGGDVAATPDNITEDAAENVFNLKILRPIDFQCFLMENIGLLSELQERKGAYKNVVRLKGGGDPGTTVSQISLGGRQDEVEQLLQLTPATYASLVPYIKIYRVDYDEEETKPIVQQEMPIPNFLDPNDIAQLTGRGNGRYAGWGLQKFSWSLDGVQPETVDNNISATLEFYFQSISDLFRGSQAYNDEGVQIHEGAGTATPNPLDLLISSETVKKVKDGSSTQDLSSAPTKCGDLLQDNVQQRFKGAHYRIKVVAGWSAPHNLEDVMPHSEPDERNALRRALVNTRISLYLQQTRHNLTFNQDGSIKLAIDYQAALTGMLTSNKADILGANDTDSKAKLKKLEEKIKSSREGAATYIQSEVAGGRPLADAQASQKVKDHRKKIKDALEEKKKIINRDKLRKYKRFLNRLFGYGPDEKPTTAGPKIRTIKIAREDWWTGSWEDLTPEKRREMAIEKMSADPAKRGFQIHDGSSGAGLDLLAIITKELLEEKTKLSGQETSEEFKSQWDKMLTSDEMINISYFYLGDLIDAILEDNASLGSGNTERRMLTVLAQMDVVNPLLLYTVDDMMVTACADNLQDAALLDALKLKSPGLVIKGGIRKRINIGSIPISVDQFNVWFKNNVVQKERNTYYLIHFIKDICGQLIGTSLKASCFGKNVINNVRFDTIPVHFHNPEQVSVQPTSDPMGYGTPRAPISVSDFASYCGAIGEHNDVPGITTPDDKKKDYDVSTGLLLYCTDSKPRGRLGDELEDLTSGIYHNYIGAPAGLVKTISFDRIDQEYLREAKIQKFGHLGAEQLRELYSAKIQMVGNTLFKNGQYTFIHPTMVGTEMKLARYLGLGGYFLITGVSHVIGPQGYNVSVTALQEGMKFGGELTTATPLLGSVSTKSLSEDPKPPKGSANREEEAASEEKSESPPPEEVPTPPAGGAGDAGAEETPRRRRRSPAPVEEEVLLGPELPPGFHDNPGEEKAEEMLQDLENLSTPGGGIPDTLYNEESGDANDWDSFQDPDVYGPGGALYLPPEEEEKKSSEQAGGPAVPFGPEEPPAEPPKDIDWSKF